MGSNDHEVWLRFFTAAISTGATGDEMRAVCEAAVAAACARLADAALDEERKRRPESPPSVYETRARRIAHSQGFHLSKSKRRDHRAFDYDGYMVTDLGTNAVIFGGEPHAHFATLDDVERFLLHGGNSAAGRAVAKILKGGKHITEPERGNL